MSSKYSRVCAEIDMDAIAENFRIMHEAIHPETKMVAVIKTDGITFEITNTATTNFIKVL